MIDKSRAVFALYPQVVVVNDATGAFDVDGNKVEIDQAAVNAWKNPDEYKIQRAAEYPSFAEQFDLLYHGGYDAWKSVIQAVKDKYPKGQA